MITDKLNLSLNNPIICNHKAYGQELLPGLAYIDIIFQIFRTHHYSYTELELRNLTIYNPLIVRKDHHVMLSVQCSENKEGQWRIRVEGQEEQKGTSALDKKLYVTAEMYRKDPVVFDEILDLKALKQSAKNVFNLKEVYAQCRRQELVHTGFMEAEGKVYAGETFALLDISLGQEALPGAERFMFHPALIDGSGVGSGGLFSSLVKEEKRLFLPLFYESFRASALLQKQCVTRIQTSSVSRKKELLYLTLEFFNESGKKVGELKNLVSKLVRGAGLINPVRNKTPDAANPASSIDAESFLRQLLAERLKKPVDQIETRIGYYEMGLDSPGLLEVVKAIETKIETDLPPTLLFEYTTIDELSAYLTENFAAQFSRPCTVMPGVDREPGNSIDPDYPTAAQAVSHVATMPAIENEIAIIGMAGRYPKARNLREFWHNLKEGKDCISEIPESRWDWQRFEGLRSPSGKKLSKWGGFIDDPDCFDPQFFRILPREAETMDPQERLFLEVCWEAIEDAGYTPKTLVLPQGPNKRRHVGVFAGVMHKDYTLVGAEAVATGQVFPLSLNYAPIANRVSYFCNFHGPSMVVDTVCSSSLTAVHLALESIRHGECEVALAGGVNLALHPNKYLTYGMWDFHSSDGYCHTFGKGGDGYVSGEGIGAVLLKPLHKAVQDRDHIYAVIKGSAINHGGTVSGITVPSPVAQADVIAACLEKAGINPRTISYVEAHGTGTSLGDPIEMQGLVKAYGQYTQDRQFCSIGSVKSNVGHVESAAGISGLTKVALQLYHKTLVPSLHSEELNPYIDFKESPFYVQHQTEEWKQPSIIENGLEVSYPRRAGLSSFGATGSNAHIILEEYLPKETQQQPPASLITEAKPAIIPLSARNQERLQAYARKLLEFLNLMNHHQEVNLADLAYTLQVGREAMEERAVFLAKDIRELIAQLEAFGEGKEPIDNCWQGQVNRSKETIDLLSTDQDSLELIHKWMAIGNVRKIAELWVKGFAMEWELIYGGTTPQRISLPTYPFVKERYWVPEVNTRAGGTISPTAAASIHPLLHQNTSDFSEQRFSSTFTGQEFFLSDHVVKGERVLPGVACLEMARAAVEQAAGALEQGQTVRLKNVVWAWPIAVGDQPLQVHTGLYPEDNGAIAYEIYSESEDSDAGPVVHSQGIAVLSPVAEVPALDLDALQAECSQGSLSSSQCYEAFRSAGIDYSPGHQGIEQVFAGPGQVLAKLSSPAAVSGTGDKFVLHPGMMDSALQASIGLIMNSVDAMSSGRTAPLKPILPLALKELEILGKCTSPMWTRIRYSAGSEAGDKAQKLDIDLCDDQGTICVRMKGMEFHQVKMQTQEHLESFTDSDTGTLKTASVEHLKVLIAEVTKIPVNRLEPEVHFEELGLDSIMISKLNQKIEQWVGKLDTTLFFKYNSIRTLGAYFAEAYPDAVSVLANKTMVSMPAQNRQSLSLTKETPALVSIRSAKSSRRQMVSSVADVHANTDIAIIGVAGRYPQAATLNKFWKNLYDGKDCVEEIPPHRWSLDGFFEPDRAAAVAKGLSYSKWGGFLDDIDRFDPLFFNISPRDAMYMDPQERLFLEVAWECLEDAGYTRKALQQDGYGNQIGVFVGATFNNYQLFMAEAAQRANQDMYAANSQIFSIANRVSFVMNFTGPSLTVDTACSSSLYAVHLACESIRSGQSRMAIAGGVNLSLHPSKYITLSLGQFNASDGRCRAFCEGGTGYVPSEAVGAIFLKPLRDAIKDDDLIYGVIKGTAASHGGKTNGYTVPSPVAQSLAIEEALRRSRINPRSISCIEAHGTGTALGDPIEITGLTDVFRKYTKETGFCSIASVKSNIGHAEAAAGIAQLTKVILQFKHQTLVKNVMHGEGLNPDIDFAQTPFVVQESTEYWQRPIIDGREVPRRAGISSFGAGGANAHVVLEEYIPGDQTRPSITITHQNPAIIVLSAKDDERLKEQARRILAAVREQQLSDADLADMAFTLQVGRQAMEERLAVSAGSMKELEEKLQGFVEGREVIGDMYRGQVKRNKEAVALFAADEELQEAVDKWVRRGKYAKLLDLWVKGLVFDWNKLYGDAKPRRISLPTYPFAGERCWITGAAGTEPAAGAAKVPAPAAVIHPLLHQNTSDFSEQRFSSTFTGQEFFLADHIVKGQRVLPGVAYLELARAAVEQAAGTLKEELAGIRLKNVVWARPIIVGEQPVRVHIGLYPEDNGEIAYEIYSESQENDTGPVVHSQGSAVLSPATEAPALDLPAIQARCSQSSFSSSQYYQAFRSIGLDYGPAHRGIEQVYVDSGQLLAKLALPAAVSDTGGRFVLHPSLLDSALQASIVMMFGSGDLKPVLPFVLQELEILGPTAAARWVLIRYSEGSKAGDKVQKLDIDLCDETGTVCARMKGLEMHENAEAMNNASLEASLQTAVVHKTQETTVSNTKETFELMTFEEFWQEQALADTSPTMIKTMVCFLSNPENQQEIIEAVQTLNPQTEVIFISQSSTCKKQSQQRYSISRTDGNTYEEAFRSIREDYGEVDAVLYLWALEEPSCIQDYSGIVFILQGIASTKLKARRFLLAGQYDNELDRCYLESWIGFERSLGLVMPNTQVAAIYQEAREQGQETTMKDWMRRIWAELQSHKVRSVLYQEGKRHVYKVRPTTIETGHSLLRTRGTYLITGGCGGLGFLFAEYFAKTQPVNLILTGRSPIDEKKQSKIKTLENLGSQVLYVQADVCDPNRMNEGLNRARERFGGIDGVIHAAGIEITQSIFKKEIQNFQKVLAPKIKGTLVLDELLDKEALDFICYFSSSAAILGDFGSCDYAIANRFLMAYAHCRNHQQRKGQRQGKAIVINWPLWKDGGMGFGEDENTKMYLKSSGQRFLEAEEGLAMFERLLAQNNIQHLVLVGQRSRVHHFLGLMQDQPSASIPVISSPLGKGRRAEMKGLSLEQCLEWDLKEHTGKLLKIPRDKLDREENLADFGFDSISLAQFATMLASHYEIEITPALFFGYSTIERLSQYFATEHLEAIQEFYKEDAVEQANSQRTPVIAVTAKRQRSPKPRLTGRSIPQSVPEPIAIIGMSGRFPQARNIDEMWRILSEGQDVVKEIPADRFDWRQYYGDPVKEPGKTDCKWCGSIPGVSEFDPLFFEISPKEAETMDPRQRLLLQESWKALEDAGYGAAQIKKSKIGMFVGAEEGDYYLLVKEKGSITSNHNAILAARLSYFLNLSGPNMAINTACSSGLVAAHQACLSLRNLECDTAIAAGVSLLLTPAPHIMMSQAGMLSPDGKCFAFDRRANGLVPGEAVAVVVLKRLSQAQADGDPIYAVIRGSGINYDGKTNGITAPSGVSQTTLLKSIYDQYKVNPEEIEYIVSHGTGTKLGDPVEINALYDAFKDYIKKQGYCALTSAKTNFGHTFAASGIVSLISLVQALRHETIPASLHCEQENDYINWQESPFYVNKTSKPWPQRDGKRRTGAVSAFGMSGTNAHMVIQSYSTEGAGASIDHAPYYLLALSAKTQEALQEKIKDMIAVLQNQDLQEQGLSLISYTLLEGRQHFNHRCAIVVQDREDAVYVLQQVGSKEKLPNLFQGTVPRDFIGQKAMAQFVRDLLKQSRPLQNNKNKYQELLFALADLYSQGYEIDWNQLYGDTKPCRSHLPTYPFARERYWVPETNTGTGSKFSTTAAASIHPLVHQNTSDFSEQRFSSTFTGREFFLSEHVVEGQRVLPGVACLEMARAAVEQAAGALEQSQSGIRLKNAVWARPIVMGDQPVRVHVGLYPDDNGEIAYEIYSEPEAAGAEPVVHSQGIAVLGPVVEAPTLDINALQAECNQGNLLSSQGYEASRSVGIDYDPAHQGIEQVYVGSGQVLAKLSLPSSVTDSVDRFVLHPGLMDAALQASLGLLMEFGDPAPPGSIAPGKPVLPFTLHELDITGKCVSLMWALIRHSDYGKEGDKAQKLDIDLCNDQGTVCVRMKGMEFHSIKEDNVRGKRS